MNTTTTTTTTATSSSHIINEPWVAAAATTDALVADLLLRLKRSSTSPPPPGWGDRKSRSKGHHQQRSPTTPLSLTDGYDHSTRSSDLFSVNRSVIKIDMHHEDSKRERESGSEGDMMKRRRCMLPDLNETPAQAYDE